MADDFYNWVITVYVFSGACSIAYHITEKPILLIGAGVFIGMAIIAMKERGAI